MKRKMFVMFAVLVLGCFATGAASAKKPAPQPAPVPAASSTTTLTVTPAAQTSPMPASVAAASAAAQQAAGASGKGTIVPDSFGGVDGGSGGSISGCAVSTAWNYDDGFSYDDGVATHYHWCWSWGQVYDNYGWSSYAACQMICDFQGFDDEYDFSYGHHTRAHWDVFSVSAWIVTFTWHTSLTACVSVDGWGRAWLC